MTMLVFLLCINAVDVKAYGELGTPTGLSSSCLSESSSQNIGYPP